VSNDHCEVSFEDATDDVEQVEFYDEKVVTARKTHTCTECGGEIAPGERYTRKTYRFEGKFHTDRVCTPCHEAAAEFEFGIVGGMLWEYFSNEWDNGANIQGCINRLTTARAKTLMHRQWMLWKFPEA